MVVHEDQAVALLRECAASLRCVAKFMPGILAELGEGVLEGEEWVGDAKVRLEKVEEFLANQPSHQTPEPSESCVHVLLADSDGTMRSRDEPFGVAVTSEEEAKRFVADGKVGYRHSYTKVRVFDNKDAALDHAFPNRNKT